MRKIWLYLLYAFILAIMLCGCSGKSGGATIGAKLDLSGGETAKTTPSAASPESNSIMPTQGIEETPASPAPAPETTPEQPVPEQTTEKQDWLTFAGQTISPEEIAAMYGEPEDVEEGEAEGVQYVIYHYRNASFHFYKDTQGRYVIEAIENHRSASPITIGGVSVAMNQDEAAAALHSRGYKPNVDAWNGEANLYFEKYDTDGYLCLVEISVDDESVVTAVRGVWGIAAEIELTSYLQ